MALDFGGSGPECIERWDVVSDMILQPALRARLNSKSTLAGLTVKTNMIEKNVMCIMILLQYFRGFSCGFRCYAFCMVNSRVVHRELDLRGRNSHDVRRCYVVFPVQWRDL